MIVASLQHAETLVLENMNVHANQAILVMENYV